MSSYGFFPAAGTDYSSGDEPTIASRLGRLARSLHLHLIGISGARTPAHSVAVGGFANDPHTRGQASDTPGIEGVTESTLNRFGLTRPFAGAREADHIQLIRSRSPTRSGATTQQSNQQSVVTQAAQHWNVPPAILAGVWGMETNFGQNVATSSAGAIGNFQFLPSTAKPYKYPLTNSPTPAQFAQQADSAAHYLSDLHKQYGNWNEALMHYSGGGYGLTQVQQKAPRGRNFGPTGGTSVTRPGGAQPATADVTSVLTDWSDAQSVDPTDPSAGDGNQFASFPIPGPLGFIPNPLDLFKSLSGSINSVTDFLKVIVWIVNPVNILRMVEVLIGLALMTFGFQAMMQAYGETKEGFVTSENPLSRSGLGRVSKELSKAVTTAVPEARAAKATKAGTGTKSTKQSTRTRKPRSAPHKSRREALRLRYEREEIRRGGQK